LKIFEEILVFDLSKIDFLQIKKSYRHFLKGLRISKTKFIFQCSIPEDMTAYNIPNVQPTGISFLLIIFREGF
jgi:hypothetical protein